MPEGLEKRLCGKGRLSVKRWSLVLLTMVILGAASVVWAAGAADLVLKTKEAPQAGKSLNVEVWVEAGASQKVDGVAVQLRFDPARMELLRVIPGEALPLKLSEKTDGAKGLAELAFGKLDAFPSGNMRVATLELRPKGTGSTALTLVTGGAFGSQVTFGGKGILGKATGVTLTVR